MQKPVQVQRALDYLKRGLNSSLWPAGARLPNVRTLARKAVVATAAMQMAIRKLANKGLLTVENSKGTYAGKRSIDLQIATRALIRWEQVKQFLRHDMLMGAFEDQQQLPNIRQLQKHYGVSEPTLRKAIKTLLAEGAIAKDRRKYRIVRIKQEHKITSILLISPGVTLTKVKIYNDKFDGFYKTLESRCIRSNISLAYCGLTAENQNEVYAYLRKNREFFGYCIFATGIAPAVVSTILHLLADRGRPVAVVDEGGGWPLPTIKYPCTLFTGAAVLAGKQVGQFLQELGHKRVAFISLYPEQLWSQKRYEGLAQAFSETGMQDCVKLVALEHSGAPGIRENPDIIKAIEKMTGIHKKVALRSSIPSLEFYETINRTIWYLAHLRNQYDSLAKHLAELTADTSITAIVGSQDFTAVLAHEYLKQQGIAVPGKISLCGFDNAQMAIEDDLTSYNFLFSNIAADVLAYIINPSAPTFADRREIECSGAIMQRSTTGPARKEQ